MKNSAVVLFLLLLVTTVNYIAPNKVDDLEDELFMAKCELADFAEELKDLKEELNID